MYCETIQNLRRSIKYKRQELLNEGVVVLHDNARSRMSRVIHEKRAKFKGEQLDYPPYSSKLSPCDFHAFGPLKKHLKGQRFNSNDELMDAVND